MVATRRIRMRRVLYTVRVSCSPAPAFGVAQARPRSAHFPQGRRSRNREGIALEGNDLGGLRRWPRLVREGARRALPPLTLSASPLNSGGRRRTTSRMARAVREGRSWIWASAPLSLLSSSRKVDDSLQNRLFLYRTRFSEKAEAIGDTAELFRCYLGGSVADADPAV